ncbi:MAG: hypothetical protein ABGZ17_25690 [Planctomycetaceae bacterium]
MSDIIETHGSCISSLYNCRPLVSDCSEVWRQANCTIEFPNA